MWIEIALVAAYTALFSFLILKLSFFQKFGVSAKWIAAIFILKVLTGIAYGVIHLKLHGGGDTFHYFNDSKTIFGLLPEDPINYIRLVFGYHYYTPHPDLGGITYSIDFYDDMSSSLLVRFHAFAGIFSFQNYNVHVVFYNFLTLIGILYLLRFLISLFPSKKIGWLIILFLFPSITFWCSGMHKDGIAIAAVGLILFFSHQLITQKFSFRNSCGLALGVGLLFMTRSYLLFLLLPCLIGWWWTLMKPRLGWLKMIAVFVGFYLLAFNTNHLNSNWDLMQNIFKRQREMAWLTRSTTIIPVKEIQPEVISLIKGAPTAFDNTLIHPTIFEILSPIQLVFALDNIVIGILFAVALWTVVRRRQIQNPTFIVFCLLFALSLYLLVGTTISNLGALVRYKMPGVLFLAVAFLQLAGKVPAIQLKVHFSLRRVQSSNPKP